jgi:hypothetical protein
MMKSTILYLTLLFPMIAGAQALSMTESACDQQGKVFVTERNKHESSYIDGYIPDPSRSFYWSFIAAHYDSHRKACYVIYDRFVRGLDRVLTQIRVDDTEGNNVAEYSGTRASNPRGPVYSKPSACKVNRTSCESISEFIDLLGKLLPAFTKSTPRGPARELPVAGQYPGHVPLDEEGPKLTITATASVLRQVS